MRFWCLILFCCWLLFPALVLAGDLTIVLAGPALVNNYPPANVVSVRGNAHPTGGNVSWGLRGTDNLTVILGTVPVPEMQKIWFGSAALPSGFPPGVYNLFARDGTEEVRGASVLLPGRIGCDEVPLEVIERIRAAAIGLAPLSELSSLEAAVWLEEIRRFSDSWYTD